MEIRTYREGDGDRLRTFWLTCGIKIRPGDDDASLAVFAARNPSLMLLAEENGHLVGSALAGWDGRRGWLYHVATDPEMQRRGVATRMVQTIEERLRTLGCRKLNLIVWDDNTEAMRFWEANGYERDPTVEYSKRLGER